jgi:hypothetical protein
MPNIPSSKRKALLLLRLTKTPFKLLKKKAKKAIKYTKNRTAILYPRLLINNFISFRLNII